MVNPFLTDRKLLIIESERKFEKEVHPLIFVSFIFFVDHYIDSSLLLPFKVLGSKRILD